MNRLKISKIKLGLWIFIMSTLFSGVVWEAVGWIALLYILIKCINMYGSSNKRLKHGFSYLSLILVVGYVCYQCLVLQLNSASIIRLYGITKTLFAIPVMLIFLDRYVAERDAIVDILPLILLVDWLTIFSLITGTDVLNLLGGSRNYLGAVNVLLFPYVFKFLNASNHKKIRFLFIVTFLLLVLFSGSRTLMLTAVMMFVGVTILEKNMNKKLKHILLAILTFTLAIFVMSTIGIANELLERSLSVFRSLVDDSRTGLQYFAEQQFSQYTELQKLVGNGDTMVLSQMKPVHNVFGEIRLCYGRIGLVFWIIYLIIWATSILKNGGCNRLYIFIVCLIAILIGLVQPFLTSGYLFQIIVALVCMQLFYSERPEKVVEQGQNNE